MGSLTKQLIGKEDLSVQYNTNDPEQFSRLNSVGGTINLYQFPDMWTYAGALRPGDIITKGPWVDVRAYGATGDGVTDDTAAINLAISAANSSKNPLFFPRGDYLITPGGLSAITCSVHAPDADFFASDTTNDRMFEVRYEESEGNSWNTFDVGEIHGLTKGPHGLLIKQGNYNTFKIKRLIGLDQGIILDGNLTDSHIAVNNFFINHIMTTNIGIVLRSGVTWGVEANRFYIDYMFNNTTAIFLDGITASPANWIASNLFDILVLELHYAANQVGFNCAGAKVYQNTFKVRGSLNPPTGTGKIISCTDNAADNYFELSHFDITKCILGDGQILNQITHQFGYPDHVGSIARSVIIGTAAPTVGYWRRGDICWNTEPSASGVPGWVCVTSGTPGTWVSMANLSGAWIPYTPTLTGIGGALTTATATGRYLTVGKTTFIRVTVTITDKGTATGYNFSLPNTVQDDFILAGRENAVTGKMLQGHGSAGATVVIVSDYNNVSTLVDGYVEILSGCYENQ